MTMSPDEFERVFLPKLIGKALDFYAAGGDASVEDIARTIATDAFLIGTEPDIADVWRER